MSNPSKYVILLKNEGQELQAGGGPITRDPWITCGSEGRDGSEGGDRTKGQREE